MEYSTRNVEQIRSRQPCFLDSDNFPQSIVFFSSDLGELEKVLFSTKDWTQIKSSDEVHAQDLRSFIHLTKDIHDCEAVVLSQDRFTKKFDHVVCYPWKQGLSTFFPEINSPF